MKLIINYEQSGEHHDLIVSIYLFHYIRIIKINLKKYFEENHYKLFPTKSYINYKNILKIILCGYKKFKKHIVINNLDMYMCIGNDNPAITAILYGILNGVAPTIINSINEVIHLQKYYIKIIPNFNTIRSDISLTCKIGVNPIFITYQYISIKRRLKKDDKYQPTPN